MKPSLNQWKRVLCVLTSREKILLLAFLILAFISSLYLVSKFYQNQTKVIPAIGGSYIEGLLGSPRFINPIYASSDVDRDLIELIFSGLFKYDQNADIVPDLAQTYEIEEAKIFKILLKDNIFWHDGQEITTEDVLFTIKTIQNPAIKSPLQANWLGVEIQKISDKEIIFKLKESYPRFLENLTLKILPAHIWQNVSEENFPLSKYNFEPIGSGPFQFHSLEQNKSGEITSLKLVFNQDYWAGRPKISQITFKFFDKSEDLILAAKKREIEALSLISPKDVESLEGLFKKYLLSLPRYFAVFFNPEKSEILDSKNVRQALNFGTDKKEIIEKVLLGYAKIVHSPILPEIYGFSQPEKIYQFNPEKAKELLAKEKAEIAFSLVLPDQPFLAETANLLKEQWEKMGIDLTIQPLEISQLKNEFLKTRDYEALLFGEVLGAFPDLFPFWHSSRKKDPGLNLALYENKKADKLLEEARQQELEIQAEKIEAFQDILIEDAPCVFLYNPDFIYLVSPKIKGVEVKNIVDPSKRFSGIENWYIKTQRVWK